MFSLLKKSHLLTNSLRVITLLAASFAISGHEKIVEECSVEVVKFEECDAISMRRESRQRLTQRFQYVDPIFGKQTDWIAYANDLNPPQTERDRLNGSGCYLLT